MENEFIPYEQAKQLKQLGFDELCIASYETENNWHFKHKPWRNSEDLTEIASPLYQQVFKWFREKHNLLSNINHDKNGYFILIENLPIQTELYGPHNFNEYASYQEAEFDCLNRLIEIIKTK